MAVRVVSIFAGAWLFLSAFLWPHGGHVALTTWIPGLLIVIVATIAGRVPRVRYVNVVLGAWVLAAAVASGADDLVMNNGLVALTVVTAAVLPPVQASPREGARAKG